MRPSCGGRLARSLSARSSSASLRLHSASGRLVSLKEAAIVEHMQASGQDTHQCTACIIETLTVLLSQPVFRDLGCS